MTYKEYIYNICNATDLDNKNDVIETMQHLAKGLIDYHDTALAYQEKLKETMTTKDYREFVTARAKERIKRDIENIEDEEFKTFCIENFDDITGGDYA